MKNYENMTIEGLILEKEEIENKMLEIYNYLLEKLETEYKSYYGCYLKLNSIAIKQKFQELSIQEKTIIINEIIKIMNIGTGNFKILGLSMTLGRKSEKSHGSLYKNGSCRAGCDSKRKSTPKRRRKRA